MCFQKCWWNEQNGEYKIAVKQRAGADIGFDMVLASELERLKMKLQWESKNTCQAFHLAASGTPMLLSLAVCCKIQ